MTLQDNLLDIPSEHAQNVYGQFDAYVKKIERTTGATVVSRDGGVKLIGNEVQVSQAEKVLNELGRVMERLMEVYVDKHFKSLEILETLMRYG